MTPGKGLINSQRVCSPKVENHCSSLTFPIFYLVNHDPQDVELRAVEAEPCFQRALCFCSYGGASAQPQKVMPEVVPPQEEAGS